MNITISNETWFRACMINDVPPNGGVCVKYQSHQIALFYFTRRNEWFATQNMCPHRQQMAISRGMLGSHNEQPKIACPFHKKTFSLTDGRCMNSDEGLRINTYPVKIDDNAVYINVSSLHNQHTPSINSHAYEKINH